MPSRDLLVAWPAGHVKRNEQAASVARLFAQSPYPIAGDLLVSTEAGLRPAMPLELADHGRL